MMIGLDDVGVPFRRFVPLMIDDVEMPFRRYARFLTFSRARRQ
jgi:hypothetical protein